MTDTVQPMFQHRIADLLDDTTEAAVAPETKAAETTAPAVHPTTERQPAPAAEAALLPPFLAQSGSAPGAEQDSLPGTALFTNSAARAAAKLEHGLHPTPAAAFVSVAEQAPPTPDGTVPAPLNTQPASGTAGEATATLETAATKAGLEQNAAHSATLAATPGLPISIKGRGDGLVVEIGKGSWSEILAALDDRLQQSASFFRNARVAVDLGARVTTEAELAPLLDLLKTYGLILGAVRTSTERTFQAALALELTTTLESAEGVPVADAAPANTNATVGAYFVYRGYLRSGHRLQRRESILVIGDVNPGAEVSSEGDVLVWGRLRGVVHAGCKGNGRAIVAALDLEPTQLRIADIITIGPDPRPGQPGKWFWRRSANKRPEIARITNDVIALEEWDAARPGGLVSLRRGG